MIDNPHRLAPASPDEDTVFGACRPGYPDDRPADETVAEWIESVRAANVSRICCLLSSDELDAYDVDVLARYHEAFDEVCHVPVEDHSQVKSEQFGRGILPFLRVADIAGDRVVVHCSAGLNRTGHVLVLWLHYARLYDLADAIQTVRSTGRRPLGAPPVNADSLADINLLTDAYKRALSAVKARTWFLEIERLLLTASPQMRIERTKYWAPITHPDWSRRRVQIHPQKTQIRLLYRLDPNDYPALSEGPASGSFGDAYPSEYVVRSREDISTAVALIIRSHTVGRSHRSS